MTLDAYRTGFKERISTNFPPEEVDSLTSLTIEHVLRMNRVEVALSRKRILTTSEITALDHVCSRLERGEPIQYIVGSTDFYGMEFLVNRSTLIPRPETEELVEWIINSCKIQLVSPQILDIGTGSGCIAIALAKNLPQSTVEGVDVSLQAIETAASNAQNNQVNVTFFQQNILEANDLPKKYDIIVSNPPYVRELEKVEIKPNVMDHEPHGALFVSDKDPLIFYRKIASLAVDNLKPGGQLYFEINEYLGKETANLITAMGFSKVSLKKDIFGKDRMVKAQL